MISIVVCAAHGVKILNHKQTQAEIIASFKKQMKALKARLNVSSLIFCFDIKLAHCISHVRVHMFQERLALPTMPGRL